MTRGGCLCGGVRYEVSGPFTAMLLCHCQMCRRMHGTPFASYAAVDPRHRRYTQGEELIREYASSAAAVRSFCSRCGSKLEFRDSKAPNEIWIAAGSFDGDPGIRSSAHIFVASKAPWYEIADDLPQYPEYPT
ncbi:MAG TPA: GFA family protein [Myxococcota bacterium]|nr:GFA family protein [Myxococcota bacterium]